MFVLFSAKMLTQRRLSYNICLLQFGTARHSGAAAGNQKSQHRGCAPKQNARNKFGILYL